jgi:transposase
VVVTMTWIGLDVHARSVEASVVDSASGELSRRRVSSLEVSPIVEWLGTLPGPVRACYEAGPTGYGLARAARAAGISMEVIAPSKTPRRPGDRIKTDRRDAELLVRQLMAGALTVVRVPSIGEEAARDVVRSREQIRRDLMRARHRVSKLLLRNGRVYPAAAGTWSQAHREWLSRQRFDEADLNLVYLDALAAVDGLIARRDALTERLRGSHSQTSGGRPSRGCARFAVSTRTPRSACISSSASGVDSNARATSAPISGWCRRSTSPARDQRAAGSRRPARSTPGGSSSRRPGTTPARRGSA